MAISRNSFSKILRQPSKNSSKILDKTLGQTFQQRNYVVKSNVKKIELRTDRPIGLYPFKHSKLALKFDEYHRQLRYKAIDQHLRPNTSLVTQEYEQNIVKEVSDIEITLLILQRNDLLQKFEKDLTKAARFRAVAWVHGLNDKAEIQKIAENPDETTKNLLKYKASAGEVLDLSRTDGFSFDFESRYPVESWFLASEIASTLVSTNKAWSTLFNQSFTPEVETQLHNGFANYLSWRYHEIFKNHTVSDKISINIEVSNFKKSLSTTFENEETTISLVNKVIDKINYASSLELNEFSQLEIFHHYIQSRNYLREITLSLIEESHQLSLEQSLTKQSNVWDSVRTSFKVDDSALPVLTTVIQGDFSSVDLARTHYPKATKKIDEALGRLQEVIESLPQETLDAVSKLRKEEVNNNEFYESYFVQNVQPLPTQKQVSH